MYTYQNKLRPSRKYIRITCTLYTYRKPECENVIVFLFLSQEFDRLFSYLTSSTVDSDADADTAAWRLNFVYGTFIIRKIKRGKLNWKLKIIAAEQELSIKVLILCVCCCFICFISHQNQFIPKSIKFNLWAVSIELCEFIWICKW